MTRDRWQRNGKGSGVRGIDAMSVPGLLGACNWEWTDRQPPATVYAVSLQASRELLRGTGKRPDSPLQSIVPMLTLAQKGC